MRIADRGFFFAAGFPLPGVMGLRGSSYFSSEHTVYPPAGGYRVLSLLRLCGRCENGVNYTLMSNAGCVAAAQNIQWTIV